jgi:DNA-binding NarL/FixJ family response regulator
MTTLFLADDHQIVRQGLRALLATVPDFTLVGEAGDGPATLRQVTHLQPNVLVMDLMMPGMNGLEVARKLKTAAPETRIVILSMHSDAAYVVEALRAGATAYVVKEAGANTLLRAIRQAALGKRYFSPPLSEEKVADYLRRAAGTEADPFITLTRRQREVLQLTVAGLTAPEIALRLKIGLRTVESHLGGLLRKLGVRNSKQMISYVLQRQGVAGTAELGSRGDVRGER